MRYYCPRLKLSVFIVFWGRKRLADGPDWLVRDLEKSAGKLQPVDSGVI